MQHIVASLRIHSNQLLNFHCGCFMTCSAINKKICETLQKPFRARRKKFFHTIVRNIESVINHTLLLCSTCTAGTRVQWISASVSNYKGYVGGSPCKQIGISSPRGLGKRRAMFLMIYPAPTCLCLASVLVPFLLQSCLLYCINHLSLHHILRENHL